jgi:hypothetical protein
MHPAFGSIPENDFSSPFLFFFSGKNCIAFSFSLSLSPSLSLSLSLSSSLSLSLSLFFLSLSLSPLMAALTPDVP